MNHETLLAAQGLLLDSVLREYSALSHGYEERLAGLGYRTPMSMAAKYTPKLPGQGRVLDLGCGTGLLGKALRQQGLQATLVGQDVSQSMLDQVPDGIYVELQRGDCLQPWVHGNGHFHAVVSAGLSEYVLDLRAWFDGVRRFLSEGSLWIFSYARSERLPVKLIGDSMLVSHARDYVRSCLSASGFEWLEDSEIEAYRSNGQTVVHALTMARACSQPKPVHGARRPLPGYRCLNSDVSPQATGETRAY